MGSKKEVEETKEKEDFEYDENVASIDAKEANESNNHQQKRKAPSKKATAAQSKPNPKPTTPSPAEEEDKSDWEEDAFGELEEGNDEGNDDNDGSHQVAAVESDAGTSKANYTDSAASAPSQGTMCKQCDKRGKH